MEGVFDIHCQSKAVADFLNSQGRLEPQTLMIIIREKLQGCLQPEVKFSFGKKSSSCCFGKLHQFRRHKTDQSSSA